MIGLVVLQIAFSLITNQTKSTAIVDDQFAASNTSCVDVSPNCILSMTKIENVSTGETLGTGNYSLCSVNSGSAAYNDGVLLDDSEYNGLTLNATYTEVDCGHVTGLTGVVIQNIPVLLAIALLVFASGFAIMKK